MNSQNRLFFLSFSFSLLLFHFPSFYTGTKETLQTEFIFSPRHISHVRNKNVATSLKSDDVNKVGKEMPNKISSNLNIIIIFLCFFARLLLNDCVLAANWSGNCAVLSVGWVFRTKNQSLLLSRARRNPGRSRVVILSSPCCSVRPNWIESDWKNWNTFKRFISFIALRCVCKNVFLRLLCRFWI